MSPIPEDRRAHTRHLVRLRVAVRDEKTLQDLHATDLSRGGVFVATRRALPAEQVVNVKLVHPVTGATFDIEAVVANVRRSKDGEVVGCGLRFTPFDDAAQGALARFVQGVVEPEEREAPLPREEAARPAEGADEEMPVEGSADSLRAHALMLRGLALSRKGNLVGAAHLLVRAVSLAPEEEELWQVLRQLEGRLDAAAERKRQEPGGGAARRADGEGEEPDETAAPEAREPSGERKARLLFDAARKRYRDGEFDGAISALEQVVELEPRHAPALYALAGLLTERGDEIGRAVGLCRRAVEIDPSNEDYRDALASLEGILGEDRGRDRLENR